MSGLSADVKTYYVEEVANLLPSCVVYQSESEELFWNTDRAFDSLNCGELREWTKHLQTVIQEAVSRGDLRNGCLHIRPQVGATNRTGLVTPHFLGLVFDKLTADITLHLTVF